MIGIQFLFLITQLRADPEQAQALLDNFLVSYLTEFEFNQTHLHCDQICIKKDRTICDCEFLKEEMKQTANG
jgi:hypothetical protein